MRVWCRWLACGTFALWIGAGGTTGADPVFGDAFMSRYVARSHSFLQIAQKSNSDERYCAHVLAGDTGPLPGAPLPRFVGLRLIYESTADLPDGNDSIAWPHVSRQRTRGSVIEVDVVPGHGVTTAGYLRNRYAKARVIPLCVEALSKEAASCERFQLGAPGLDIPNDEGFDALWGHRLINWRWSIAKATLPVAVAVLDSGIDCRQTDLRGKFPGAPCLVALDDGGQCNVCPADSGEDYVDGDPKAGNCRVVDGGTKYDRHGTHMAGTIAATGDNHYGLVGVAPNARLRSYRVLKSEQAFGDVARIRKAIPQAHQDGARVINMSLYADRDSGMEPLCDELEEVTKAGNAPLITVMSQGTAKPYFTKCKVPAPKLLSVSAIMLDVDDYLELYAASPIADIHAPGVYIYSTSSSESNLNAYEELDGSSNAVAYVSGAAAHILGTRAFQACSADQVSKLLQCTARTVWRCNVTTPLKVLDLKFLQALADRTFPSCSAAIEEVGQTYKDCAL